MKITEPRGFAFYSALLIVGFFSISIMVLHSILNIHVPLLRFALILLVMDAILVILAFFILQFFLEKFIYEKIKVIYKTIRNLKAPKDARRSHKINDSLLEDVNEEVEEWSRDKRKEIAFLKDREAYRREYIGNVSHELKTPIFNIQGYVHTLLDGALEDPSINRDYLQRTARSVDRMIAIVEDLEGISQLETGELKLTPVVFDILRLTREIVDFLEIKAQKKGVAMRIVEPWEKEILVFADKEKIRQVLINLVDNAIRYCGETDPKIKISFFEMEETILVEVTDNGIGIREQDLPRIFDRFFRTEKGREVESRGKGLGLSIVKHILEAQDQSIHVRSTIGIGTTFSFTLARSK